MGVTTDRHPTKAVNGFRRGSGLPLVTIAGASGKTSTGWRLIELLESGNVETAAWLSDGVYVDNTLRDDELHAWELATLAARAREVDILIQEVPSVLATNLPERSVQLALLTAICGSDDQCRRDSSSEKEVEAACAVTAALRPDGAVVASADDLMIVDVASSSGRDVTYFAMHGANPILRNHVKAGGNAVWTQNGWVKAQIAGEKHRIVKVSEIPGTLSGHLIYEVQNALGATAALVALGVDEERIASMVSGLSLVSRTERQAGTTIHEFKDRTMIVDQPRTLLAVKQLVRGVKSFGARRVIQRIGALRDFSDDDVNEAARVLGSLGGIAIVAAHESSADRVELIRDGLMSSDNPPVIMVRDQDDATIDYVGSMLDSGDVALYLGER